MNKKFLSAILFGALMVTSTGTFVSCKDYDDDIENLQGQVDTNKSAISALESQLSSLNNAGAEAKAKAESALAAAEAAKAAGDEAKALAKAAEAAAEKAKEEAIAKAKEEVEIVKAMVESQKLSIEELSVALAALSGEIEGIDAGLSNLKTLIDANGDEIAKALQDIKAVQADLENQKSALAKLQENLANWKEGSTSNEALDAKIQDVNSKIEETYTELYDLIGQTSMTLSTFMTDYEAAMAKLVEYNNVQDANINTLTGLIETLIEVDGGLEGEIAELWQTISGPTGITEQMNGIYNSLTADINDKIATLHTLVKARLTSMVFVPYLYVDGIEATEYAFGLSSAKDGVKATEEFKSANNDNNIRYKYVKDQVISYKNNNSEWYVNPAWTVEYHLNASTAKVTTEQLSFASRDAEVISSRAAGENLSVTKPAVANSKIDKGVLYVDYTALGKELKKLNAEAGTTAVMALKANVKNGEKDTIITSDYAQLYPSQVIPQAISFSQKGYGKEGGYNACTENTAREGFYHIALTADDAIKNAAPLQVEYNGSLELKDYLEIHYNQSNKACDVNDTKTAGTHKIWAYGEEAQFNLEYRYSLVEFTIGDFNDMEMAQQTKENRYGYVDATGHFEPRYVDAEGNSIASNGTSGVSSIGKKPVVRVEVVDKTTEEVILGGFVKIEIVRTIDPVFAPNLNLGKQPYACWWIVNYANWAQYSSLLLETAAVTSKAEFEQLYILDKTVQNNEDPLYQGPNNEWYAIVYTKDAQGNMERLDDNFYFGYIEEYGNTQGVANDRIQWQTAQVHRDRIYAQEGHKVTVYICYKPRPEVGEGTRAKIYVPLTLEIVKPEATYGDKIPEYWYENETTQRLNVLFPKDNQNTENYTVDLNNAFVGNKIKFTITNNEDGLFDKTWAAKDYIKYDYIFTANNNGREYVVDGKTYTLKISADGKTLYAANGGTSYVIAKLNQGAQNNSENIMYAGVTAPTANAVAKKLLNAWAHDDDAEGHKYYANVGIRAYNECEIVLNTWEFNARFLRPVDVEGVNGKEFTDAEANGSVINVADLLNFSDWRNIAFTGANGWLYAFYDIKGLAVDTEGITTTMNGGTLGKTLLKNITTKCKFTQQIPSKTFSLSEYNSADKAAACLTAVKTALGSIKYENNGNNVKDFDVRIPVTVSYEWGDIVTYVDCHVHNTLGN